MLRGDDALPARDGACCFILLAAGNDDLYLRRGTLTCIRSLKRTNPDVPIVVLHHDLRPEQQLLFAGTILKRFDLGEFSLSPAMHPARPDIPVATFLSLFVELVDGFDRAVYIDADSVVLDSLDELFAWDMPLGARVMDEYALETQFSRGRAVLEEENIAGAGGPINNGIVFFDLKFWRGYGLLAEAVRLFRKYGPDAFTFSDQSLLNLIAYRTGTLRPFSRLYNFCRYPDMLALEHSLERNSRGFAAPRIRDGLAKVVHWTGVTKPWSLGPEAVPSERLALCLECYDQFQ